MDIEIKVPSQHMLRVGHIVGQEIGDWAIKGCATSNGVATFKCSFNGDPNDWIPKLYGCIFPFVKANFSVGLSKP